MRVCTFEHNNARAVGRIDGETITPLADLTEIDASTTLDALLAAETSGDPVPLAEVRLLPPVPNPAKVICVGLNYKAHVEESNRDLPTYPVLFAKYASNLIGADDDIVAPPESLEMDFEAELAVIMGRRVRRVSEDEALDAVMGYAVSNDITMRDYQYKTHQWMQGKAWDNSTPIGPMVTADEIDPANLTIRLELNGEEMQSSDTSRLIFPIPRLIATISEFTELNAGDVILTGTPSGVGWRRDPRLVLKDGDVLTVEIANLGSITNTVRSEQA